MTGGTLLFKLAQSHKFISIASTVSGGQQKNAGGKVNKVGILERDDGKVVGRGIEREMLARKRVVESKVK